MSTSTKDTDQNPFITAGAIVIAGGLIALSIMFGKPAPETTPNDTAPEADTGGEAALRLPENDEHRLGPARAEFTIIEYSDFECPFCARFHPTMERVVEQNSNVAWVYRHLPLSSIHPEAFPAAVASECIANLAGNEAFWETAGMFFNNQGALGEGLYLQAAISAGISEADFTSCIASEEALDAVREDAQEAIANGGNGTPFSILITPDGDQIPISGALPYEQVQAVIDQAKNN